MEPDERGWEVRNRRPAWVRVVGWIAAFALLLPVVTGTASIVWRAFAG